MRASPIDLHAYGQTYFLNHQDSVIVPPKPQGPGRVNFNNVDYNPQIVSSFGPNPLRLDTNITHDHFQDNTPSSYIDSSSSLESMIHGPAGWTQGFIQAQGGAVALSGSMSSSISSSPVIKSELSSSPPLPSTAYPLYIPSPSDISSQYRDTSEANSPTSTETAFNTNVDNLMRVIQSRNQGSQQQTPVPSNKILESSGPTDRNGKRSYHCTVSDCPSTFHQKTHLAIHMRAHTGVKPFLCKFEGCGQRFSQAGNLRTHERRHTGERPYKCDLCDKTFAQRGNVRAHRSVHTQDKPFLCQLDDCNKRFTQLGNLKSHQNKFHIDTIRNLRERFENLRPGETVSPWEENMWRYFCDLYKHCNKGIKGRGRRRKISEAGCDGSIKQEDREIMFSTGQSLMPHYEEQVPRRLSSSSIESTTSAAQQGFFDYHDHERRDQHYQPHLQHHHHRHQQQQTTAYHALPVMGSAPAMTGLCIGIPKQAYEAENMSGFHGAAGFYQ